MKAVTASVETLLQMPETWQPLRTAARIQCLSPMRVTRPSPDEARRNSKVFLVGPSVAVDDMCRNAHYCFVSLDVYSLKTTPLQRQLLLRPATPVVSVRGSGALQALWPEQQLDCHIVFL